MNDPDPKGIVFDIQRGALRDGPGIRTTVFLKGCPLRCVWCHNPESQSLTPQTGQSGKIYGREMSVSEIMTVVCRDKIYYKNSGGGLTLSGGEPTVQYDFCVALLKQARAEGIHTCLDTSGHLEPSRFQALAPLVDLFLFDYKATGEKRHLDLVGKGDHWISANLGWLGNYHGHLRLRCPMVPDVNDQPEHFAAIRELVKRLPYLEGIDVLPYHEIGSSKYEDLEMKPPALSTHVPDEDDKNRWRAALLNIPVPVTVG